MAKSHTTATLIESLKRRAMIPTSQATYTDQDLVDYLNDEMESTIVPMIMDVREEYFIESQDFSIENDVDAFFDIPTRAVGSRLREVVLVDTSNGVETLTNLPRLTLEQLSESADNGRSVRGLTGFYIEGDQVRIYPAQGGGAATLRMYYYRRPGQLVLTSDAGEITAIDTGTNTITVDNVLAEWINGADIATVNPRQPFNYINASDSIVSISGYNITLADVSDLSVGDWVCNVDESVVPQVPVEAHNLLLQAAKIVLLEATDDDKNIQLAMKKYEQLERSFIKTITPRVDGQGKKIVGNNALFRPSHNWSW